jgi:hypothetical protein
MRFYLDMVEPVLRAVRLRAEHGEEVGHGLHLPHGLGVKEAGLDALFGFCCVDGDMQGYVSYMRLCLGPTTTL